MVNPQASPECFGWRQDRKDSRPRPQSHEPKRNLAAARRATPRARTRGFSDSSFTDYLNNTPKYVVSETLQEPLEWQNSTLINADVAEEIAKLKRQPGKDITIIGSGTLVRSLLEDDLLDELRLMVHPIVLGSGKRLFEEGSDQKVLELVDAKTFGTGVLYLTYQPVHSSSH